MKALEPYEGVVAFAEVPEPRPWPDEVLIKVEAFSPNRGETFLLDDPRPGWRPGKDIAGLVVQAAADGTGPAVGRRVVAHPPASGWAEYVAVPTSRLAALPESLPTATAAALPLAGLTALRLLRTAGDLDGRTVLVTGASGGVGHYFVEMAAAQGAVITAVTSTPERGRRLLELGAAHVVHEVTAAQGPYDVVLESVGGGSLPQALARLALRGLLIWFGQASRQPVCLNFFDFFKGPTGGRIQHFHYEDFPESYADDLAVLVDLVTEGRLHPEIGRISDWTETSTVITDLRDRRIRGNAVLTTGTDR